MARFTEEQYRYARDRANALDYAQRAGYHLVKDGMSYRLREHDSMVFMPDGRWFWNSRGLRGRAIEFVMAYEQKTLPEAVLTLCAVCGGVIPNISPNQHETYAKRAIEKKEFVLPTKAPNCRRLVAYLCGTRKLDKDIARSLLHSGNLYESVRTYVDKSTGEVKEAHNAVFVGYSQGIPRSAFQRGLSSYAGKNTFKRDAAGSDPAAPFCIPGRKETTDVVVFEGAINAISHASIYKLAGLDYMACNRIALGGTEKLVGLLAYLEEHPQTTDVWVAFDEDAAGQTAWERVQAITQKSIRIYRLHQHGGNDWNDYLCLWHDVLERQPRYSEHRIIYLNEDNSIATTEQYADFESYQKATLACLIDGKKIIAIK